MRQSIFVSVVVFVAALVVLPGGLSPLGDSLQTPLFAQDLVDPVLWPDEQREFLLDGPGWLVSDDDLNRLLEAPDAEREALIATFQADPIPETDGNELAEGIRRRTQLMRTEFMSPLDVRAKLLFLHGVPVERLRIDCGSTFKPLEIWTFEAFAGYPGGEVVVYEPKPSAPYKIWLPIDTKRILYKPDMEYFLQQWEELGARISGRRIDRQACEESKDVDLATGVDGLYRLTKNRPSNKKLQSLLGAPGDLAAWSQKAAQTPITEGPEPLEIVESRLSFPRWQGQRLMAEVFLKLPEGAPLVAAPELDDKEPELRLTVEGVIETGGELFERFRIRFRPPPAPPADPTILVFDRFLRPGGPYLLRYRLVDELGGASVVRSVGFVVPDEPDRRLVSDDPDQALAVMGEELRGARIAGKDSLLIVPPAEDVIIGLWRADTLVTGDRIEKVGFYVDGTKQLTDTRLPFSAELRLAQFPKVQVIKAEGYDAAGEVVASDEVLINQPRGAFGVRIVEPARGVRLSGTIRASAEIIVPDGRRVEEVEFLVDNDVVETRAAPPWETRIQVPQGTELSYLTVVAILDDGTRAEDVRFLNAPKYLDEVDVNLVELYTSVIDRNGQPVLGLSKEDFEVTEQGRKQEIAKFELVQNLPLVVGVAIDTSGSMSSSLVEAQDAATSFLESIISPSDKTFVVAFSTSPRLLTAPTDDVRSAVDSLKGLQAYGWTAMHDALVTSLYYFRGFRGQRALVLLSDGDDTRSYYDFDDAFEYARRSGVAIYTIGLDVGKLKQDVRNKLRRLAVETGGRAYFVGQAEELSGVYKDIENELRSRYLIAYNSSIVEGEGFREVEVKVDGRGLKARTARGYYR